MIAVGFHGDDLEFVVEDLDELPAGDLTVALVEAVPSGTPVVINRVGGERLALGPAP